jgi:hypothetical protein
MAVSSIRRGAANGERVLGVVRRMLYRPISVRIEIGRVSRASREKAT